MHCIFALVSNEILFGSDGEETIHPIRNLIHRTNRNSLRSRRAHCRACQWYLTWLPLSNKYYTFWTCFRRSTKLLTSFQLFSEGAFVQPTPDYLWSRSEEISEKYHKNIICQNVKTGCFGKEEADSMLKWNIVIKKAWIGDEPNHLARKSKMWIFRMLLLNARVINRARKNQGIERT